mgnify:CR=1 FL=1
MHPVLKPLLIACALGLAACASPDRFDDAPDDVVNRAGGGGIIPGSANDPTSPAYFQEAIGDRVFFVVDQSTLSPQARQTLDAQAAWLTTNSDYLAVIEGHADEQGTREYNIALGARRANAVMEYLVSKGIPQSRMRFISYGKERPVELCSEEACYAKNRRAVTIISAGLTS